MVDPGVRVAMDVTGCSIVSYGGNKYAHVKMDFGSGKKWVSFLKKKSEAVKDGLKFVAMVIARWAVPPQFVRMDNSQENKKIARMLKDLYPNI